MSLWLAPVAIDVGRLTLLITAFALTDAGLTTWNDICDVETDTASKESQRNTRPIASGMLSVRWARLQVATLLFAALVTAALISIWFGVVLTCGAIYGLVYSARPVYAGGRPLVSQLFWVVLWPAMYAGIALVMDGRLGRGWIYLVGVVLYMGIGETLAKDIRDIENDSKTGKNTTPVVFGYRRTVVVSAAAFVLGSAITLASSFSVPGPWNAGLTGALAVILSFWCVRAVSIARRLRDTYSKSAARQLHVDSIQFFIVINLLFIVELAR
jgi:4-hydroxybenzoate polyprenyltransferase